MDWWVVAVTLEMRGGRFTKQYLFAGSEEPEASAFYKRCCASGREPDLPWQYEKGYDAVALERRGVLINGQYRRRDVHRGSIKTYPPYPADCRSV